MIRMTQSERIAVLETEMRNQEESLAAMRDSMASMAIAQRQMLDELTRYRTIWGVVTMIAAALFAVLSFAKDWLLELFR